MEEIEYPVRINRYLYLSGICSRRMADTLIERGEVNINGKVALLGQKVYEGDTVTLSKDARKLPERYRYFAYYKPQGVVSHNPQRKEKDVLSATGLSSEYAPLGRLDKESEGLMLMTNDGRIVDRLLNPKFGHERTYRVVLDKKVSNWFVRHLKEGVDIEGYVTKPARAKKLSEKEVEITLTEGKKHQIRRMAAALGYQVIRLVRLSLGPIALGRMKKGELRELSQEERTKLLETAGISRPTGSR